MIICSNLTYMIVYNMHTIILFSKYDKNSLSLCCIIYIHTFTHNKLNFFLERKNYLIIIYLLYVLNKLFFRPQEISADFFDASLIGKLSTLDKNKNAKEFDQLISSTVNIIVSYDMGWSKRGNGR